MMTIIDLADRLRRIVEAVHAPGNAPTRGLDPIQGKYRAVSRRWRAFGPATCTPFILQDRLDGRTVAF